MLPLLNRTVLVVRAKQPMADWLADLPDKHETEIERPITVADINRDSAVFLIPEFDMEEETEGYIQEIKPELFEEILESWHTEPSEWPKDRTPQMFDAWFDVEFHTVINDLCDEPLLVKG